MCPITDHLLSDSWTVWEVLPRHQPDANTEAQSSGTKHEYSMKKEKSMIIIKVFLVYNIVEFVFDFSTLSENAESLEDIPITGIW